MTAKDFRDWMDNVMGIDNERAARLLGVTVAQVKQYRAKGGPAILYQACQYLRDA